MIGYGIAGVRECVRLFAMSLDLTRHVQYGIYSCTPPSKSCLEDYDYDIGLNFVSVSAFYPTYISVVNLLQSLHYGGALNHKRRSVKPCSLVLK